MATLDGTDSDRDTEAGELVDWPSSSSVDLSSDEISTMDDGTIFLFGERVDERCAHRVYVLPYKSRGKTKLRGRLGQAEKASGKVSTNTRYYGIPRPKRAVVARHTGRRRFHRRFQANRPEHAGIGLLCRQ